MQDLVEDSAAYIANFGFVNLALPFYRVVGLPKFNAEKDVEIGNFEEEYFVFVRSRREEMAFAMMSYLPQVKAVCTINAPLSPMSVDMRYKNKRVSWFPDDVGKIRLNDSGTVLFHQIFL